MKIRPVHFALVVLLACASSEPQATPDASAPDASPPKPTMTDAELAAALDAYIDLRFTATDADTSALVTKLESNHITPELIDAALLRPRASYSEEDPRDKVFETDIDADHVADFKFHTYLRVPGSYDPATPVSLVFVGHGGNSAMSQATANDTASQYIRMYSNFATVGGMILIAPATTKGWLGVGNSILFSAVSWAARRYNIDPNKIYVTGQSMGGHLTYRTALTFSDRFAAYGPQSGGYDFTSEARGKIAGNLFDNAGYATYGTAAKGELYGIGDDNNILKAWVEPRKYDWTFVERQGGHEIYPDEHPKMVTFFNEHPRNMYKKRIFVKTGGGMKFVEEKLDTWVKKEVAKPGTILRWNTRYWLEIVPRDDSGPITVDGTVSTGNTILLNTSGGQKFRVWLHPKMGIDMSKPVTIKINDQVAFQGAVKTNLTAAMNQVRELDDRGRFFYGYVDVTATSTRDVPDPSYP